MQRLTCVKSKDDHLVQTLRGHVSAVMAVAFSPDGKHIASGSDDTTIQLWDATTGDYKKALEGHRIQVTAVAFSPDGKHIALGSNIKTVKLSYVTTGDHKKTVVGLRKLSHSCSVLARWQARRVRLLG
jgi:WD40 repeat protein